MGIEDSINAIELMLENRILLIQSFLIIVSIAIFNSSAFKIFKLASTTVASTIDICRTVIIWVVFLLLGKETFIPLQLLGFTIVVLGTLKFNKII